MVKLIIIKKKWIIIGICIFISMTLALSSRSIYYKAVQTFNLPSTGKVVVVDPGHGGIDPGAVGKTGKHEKDINLAIAHYLKDFLEQSGTIVIMTREEDIGLYTDDGSIRKKKREDLKNRKNIVVNSNADVFISVHLNSFPQTKYYGAQTFYPKGNEKGKMLATIIQEEFRSILDKNNKRVPLQKNGIYLIEGLQIPTVLVECGFLSNPNEERLLDNKKYQKKIAWAIYSGIQKYFESSSE